MELAKVTSKGQITIPKEIREKLGLKEGSKVVFIEKDGEIIIKNSVIAVLDETREFFSEVAEKYGLKTEEDVVKFIKDFRKEEARKEKKDKVE